MILNNLLGEVPEARLGRNIHWPFLRPHTAWDSLSIRPTSLMIAQILIQFPSGRLRGNRQHRWL